METQITSYQLQTLLVWNTLENKTRVHCITGCTRKEAKQLDWWLVGISDYEKAKTLGLPTIKYAGSRFVGTPEDNNDIIYLQPLE